MIELRRLAGGEDVELFLRLRNEIHPREPFSAAAHAALCAGPGFRVDLLAFLDGEPAGVGSVSRHWFDPVGPAAFANVRVLPALRRRGVGTALHAEVSAVARAEGKERLYTVVPDDDADSLAFFGHRGYVRVREMQRVRLLLEPASSLKIESPLPLVPLEPELDERVYDAAVEAEADIGAAAEPFETWRARQFPSHVRRDLSFAVLDRELVAGYAIMEELADGVGEHAMTGVRRAYRGRGIALALKRAQIAAARIAGLHELRAANELGNAPMRRINEVLGYERIALNVHLEGPAA